MLTKVVDKSSSSKQYIGSLDRFSITRVKVVTHLNVNENIYETKQNLLTKLLFQSLHGTRKT